MEKYNKSLLANRSCDILKTHFIVAMGLLVFLSFIVSAVEAQEKLHKLVQERELLHRQWQESESQKSGIFGNRTKKDMTATNEWMGRIIQKDNQIIQELELLKNIETTEISHEKEDYKYIAQKAEADIVKLKRALQNKDEDIREKQAAQRTYEWISLIFFLSTMALGYLYYRAKRRTRIYG
jgi:hypothetical protein